MFRFTNHIEQWQLRMASASTTQFYGHVETEGDSMSTALLMAIAFQCQQFKNIINPSECGWKYTLCLYHVSHTPIDRIEDERDAFFACTIKIQEKKK